MRAKSILHVYVPPKILLAVIGSGAPAHGLRSTLV